MPWICILNLLFLQATIGVGLGLPGHMPGLADKTVMKEGVRQSEDYQIEQVSHQLRITLQIVFSFILD